MAKITKDQQHYTKCNIENSRLSNINPHKKNRGNIKECKQIPLHILHLSLCSYKYKHCYKSYLVGHIHGKEENWIITSFFCETFNQLGMASMISTAPLGTLVFKLLCKQQQIINEIKIGNAYSGIWCQLGDMCSIWCCCWKVAT